MKKLSVEEHIAALNHAESQFKLVTAVRAACAFKTQPLEVPEVWTYGKETIHGRDLKLSQDEAEQAAAVLGHTATYTLCLEAAQAIKDVVEKPREHSNSDVVAAFEIARLIRNAYAHQPFCPIWSIDKPCRNKVYAIAGIISLDTRGINLQSVKWQHYGGLLSLFKFSRWIRRTILNDCVQGEGEPEESRKESRFSQQGNLLIKKGDKVDPEKQ